MTRRGEGLKTTRRWARAAANTLTALRAAILTGMILLAQFRHEVAGEGEGAGGGAEWAAGQAQGAVAVILLGIIGWTTDIFDGKLGRYSGLPGGIWAALDFPLDMTMAWVSLWVLAKWHFLPMGALWCYALAAVAAILLRPSHTTVMAFAAPVVAVPVWVAWRVDPRLGSAYLLWIAAVLWLDWRRFWGVVGSFLEGLPPQPRHYFSHLLERWLKIAE